MENDIVKDWLFALVKGLVSNPEKVVVNRKQDEMGVLFQLEVDREDMGKVIGRQGNTAKAIRTLLRHIGMMHDMRATLQVLEPDGSVAHTPKEDE